MIDENTAPTTGSETNESPLLGAFSLPEGFYGDDSSKTTDDKPGNGSDEGADGQGADGTQESDGSEEQNAGETDDSASESRREDENDGEITVSSVSELIESQEWDPEWFNGLKVPVKVDGHAAEATIKDLVDGYQMREAAEKRLEDAKTKAKALNQELSDKSKALEVQYATAAKLIQKAETLLDEDVSQIDWKTLREEDPAEYAAKKAEIQERRDRINRMKGEAVDEYEKTAKSRLSTSQSNFQERLAAEQKALLEKLPEWRDADKAKAEQARLARYLIDQGFSEQDVMGASDHRLIVLARKAMRHDETAGRTDAAKKKVAKIPKTLKPGSKSDGKPKPHPKDAAEILYGKS